MYVCSQKLVYNCHVIVCATETPRKRNRTHSHHPSVRCGRSNSAPMRSSPSRPRQYYDRPSSFYYDDSYSTTVCIPFPWCGYERGGGVACCCLRRRRNLATLTVSRSSRISRGRLRDGDTVDDDREDEDNDKAINGGGGDVGANKASNLVWRLPPWGEGDEDDDDEDAGFLLRSQ